MPQPQTFAPALVLAAGPSSGSQAWFCCTLCLAIINQIPTPDLAKLSAEGVASVHIRFFTFIRVNLLCLTAVRKPSSVVTAIVIQKNVLPRHSCICLLPVRPGHPSTCSDKR